jgi:hypothetical protein
MSDLKYNQRGVSADKEDVHNAIKNIDKGIFPKAFCKIIPDILGSDDDYCNIMISLLVYLFFYSQNNNKNIIKLQINNIYI